jgi:hypothetical protein
LAACGGDVATVYVFVSTGRFSLFEELLEYIDPDYDDDGDVVLSPFMEEVGLAEYEPGCIEAIPSDTGQPVPLTELLAGASYSEQWLPALDCTRQADAAICVFAPNRVVHPTGCTMEYIGAFEYTVGDVA